MHYCQLQYLLLPEERDTFVDSVPRNLTPLIACGKTVSAVFHLLKSSRRKPSNASSTVLSLLISFSIFKPFSVTWAFLRRGIFARLLNKLIVRSRSASEMLPF